MSETGKPVLLKCERLVFGYSNKGFAAPLDFELQTGEVVALMGENGCGKSTLLKTLAGFIPPLAGSEKILAGNSEKQELVCLKEMPPRALAKRIALVRMNGSAPELMSVREFVSLGRSPYGSLFDGRNAEDERVIDESLALLDLQNFSDRPVSSLSDGERSRVYLAEAVAQQAQILLLDEPNAFLDIPRSHKLFRLLLKLAQERNMGIIVSTHSVEYAEKYCNRIMVINNKNVRVENGDVARSRGLLDWTDSEEVSGG